MVASPEHWWALPVHALYTALGSNEAGLAPDEAARRLVRFGENRLVGQQQQTLLRLLLRQYTSPLVLILVIAACVALLVGEWVEANIIFGIVIGSTLLGFSQEMRASRAVQALQARLALTVTVLRNGQRSIIPVEAVVPGDIVLLAAGNLVPADGVVIEARDFLVTQAALTGESFPVEKHSAPSPVDAPLAGRTNVVFLGTSVRSGTARMLAVTTGQASAYGAIAARVSGGGEETDFERGIRHFGILLTRVMMVIVTLVLAANMWLDRPLIDSLLFSVALAVGLTPELLPAIISVTMATGARRMAREGVIVRRLAAIENLGTVDVLCTDKTGTLTSGQIELNAATDPAGQPSRAVFNLALINARLETGIANPLDAAILAAADPGDEDAWAPTKIDEIPYDFQRKRLTVVVADGDAHLLITKGAFESVLCSCSSVRRAGGECALDEATRAELRSFAAMHGAEGIRVLALATRRMLPKSCYERDDERMMSFAGFLMFSDTLKPGIEQAIHGLSELGIAVKIISGDNLHVAGHVAHAIGLVPRMITGSELAQTQDEALGHLAEECNVFAEVDPQQKERIVRALQQRSHSVAYMGDGINDAPALRLADVGISVEGAVEVARESADIVLLQQDLGVLKRGVEDGRRTFANTLKYIAITTSANFGNMISMAIGTLFLPFLPLTAIQILLNNFLSDIPSLAVAGDRVDHEAVARAPRWDIQQIRNYMVLFGLVSTLFDLLTFGLMVQVFHAGAGLFQSAWFVISLLTELAVVLVLRTRRPCWRSRPGTLLVLATLAVGGLAVILPGLGLLPAEVGFVPLPASVLAAALGVVVLYGITTEAVKQAFYRQAH